MIEKVNPSHPDKIADRISGAIVDLAYQKEKDPKVAVECLIGHGNCHIIVETSVELRKQEVEKIVERIAGKVKTDLKVYKQDVFLSKNQEEKLRSNAEIIQHSIKDREDISHHIIICGLHPALLHFILPLRAKYLQEEALKWIVILAPSLPQSLFEAFSRFNRIIFIF